MKTEEISILVHGPVEKKNDTTKKSLLSLRRIFPGSKIILSTWKDTDLEGLDYDVLVENEDPGAGVFNIPSDSKFSIEDKKQLLKPKYNNTNRMLFSVKAGLDKVETKYVLKLRSDIVLKNSNFLKCWDKFPKYNGAFRIFEHRIINNSTYAQFAHVMKDGTQLLPFHMSDWMHFGLSSDVKLLFDCPLQSAESAYSYWDSHSRKNYDPYVNLRWQYPTETYILYSLVKDKFPQIVFNDSDDYNEKNMSQSNMVFADNFIFVDEDKFTFEMKKYPSIFLWDSQIYEGLITHLQWQNLYKTYCDAEYKFFDFDYKRLFACFFNLPFALKYPRRYLDFLRSIGNIFQPQNLREKFFILKIKNFEGEEILK